MPVSQRNAPSKRRRFLAWVVVFGAAVAIGGFEYVRQCASALPELRTVLIERRDLRITVDATGTIEPDEIVEVGALVQGRIVEFGKDADHPEQVVDVGSRVAKDSVLVQLDWATYEVDLQKAQAARRLAEAEVGRLESQLKQASRDLERAERLRATNAQSEYDKVVTAHEGAVAELAVGRARLEQATAAEKQADINLQRTSIRAPIDGVVIDRRANLGQNITSQNTGLFLLAPGLDRMRIRASVSETDIGKVKVGQPVSFSVDAHRDTKMTGRVDKILLNARINGNFVTYDVLVSIDGPTDALLPNMTADVEFETVKREQAWLVPNGTLKWWPDAALIEPKFAQTKKPKRAKLESDQRKAPREGDEAIVWVPGREGRVRPVRVRRGIDDGIMTEVIGEGFEEGGKLVVGVVKETTLARLVPSVKTVR